MKTVMKGSLVKRVRDDDAHNLVKNEGFQYVPKHVWKDALTVKGKNWRRVEGICDAVN